MNKKKLIIITAISVLIIAALVAVIIILSPEDKTKKPELIVGKAYAAVGETVEIPVTFKNNPDVVGFLFEIEYDSKKLEYISSQKGDIVKECEVASSENKLKILSAEGSTVSGDGTVAVIKFKIRPKAEGECELKLSCGNNGIINEAYENIPATLKSGKITVR